MRLSLSHCRRKDKLPMEDALRALPELEQDIIEKYFLQRKTLVDIASDLDLPYDLLMGHLRAIKARLVLHV